MGKKKWDNAWKYQVYHCAHQQDEQNNAVGITTDITQALKNAFEKLPEKERYREEFNKEFKTFYDNFTRIVIRKDFEKPIVVK